MSVMALNVSNVRANAFPTLLVKFIFEYFSYKSRRFSCVSVRFSRKTQFTDFHLRESVL